MMYKKSNNTVTITVKTAHMKKHMLPLNGKDLTTEK